MSQNWWIAFTSLLVAIVAAASGRWWVAMLAYACCVCATGIWIGDGEEE